MANTRDRTETRDEWEAEVRAKYPPDIAAVLLGASTKDRDRKRQVPTRVGNKEQHPRGIPQTKSRTGMTSKERKEAQEYVMTKDRLRRAYNRAQSKHGPESEQAHTAAAALRAHTTL